MVTQDNKPTDPLHMVAAKEVAPVNQAALLSATVVGAVATVAVDLGTPRSLPWLATFCVIGWVLAMGLTMILIGRGQPRDGLPGDGTLARYVADGWYRCITRKRYALVLALMAGLAAYAVFVKLREPEGGVLGSMFSTLKRVEASSKEAGSDLKAIRAGMETPQILASRGGYPPTAGGAAEAVANADLNGLRLVLAAGATKVAVNQGSNNPIGRLIEVKDANVAAVLDAAGLKGPELDLPFPLRFVNGKSPIPDFGQLLASQGIRVVPETDPFKEVEVMYVRSATATWSEQSGQAPPLMLAVWLNKPDAVKALLARDAQANSAAFFKLRLVERRRNANPNKEAARAYPYVLGTRDAVLQISALSEAKRLGLRDIEGLLAASGATAGVTIK